MKYKKIVFTAVMVIILLNLMMLASYASGIQVSDGLDDIYKNQNSGIFNNLGGNIINVVSYICYGVALIILIFKGVQFMSKAPEAKAEAKKELINYAIGAFILFGAGGIVQLVGNMALKNIF